MYRIVRVKATKLNYINLMKYGGRTQTVNLSKVE